MTRRRDGAVGVFTADRALVVRSWDAWLADATGIAESDATGRALAELFPELESRGLIARMRRVADSDAVEVLAPAFHEYLLACPPRAASPHFARMQQHVTISPLRTSGLVAGITVVIEDVTARRARERELARRLQSSDDAVRLHAVRTFGTDEDGLTGPLAGALGDRSWQVRRAAADGLARGRDDEAREALLDAIRNRHRDPAVLNAALSALVHARQDVLPSVAALLSPLEHDADVRTYAALALGLLEDRRAVPHLVRALEDADDNVRFHAIEALGRIRSRAAALPVATIAESRDFSVAFAALDTLALIGEPSVAPRIVPLLDDDLLQTAAADALGRLGSEEAVAPLVALLARSPSAAASVAGALAALGGRLDDGRPAGAGVADLVRGVMTPDAARHLHAALDAASDDEAGALATVLGWLHLDGIEAALASTLFHPSARRRASDALARRGARAVEPLLAAMASGDDEVRKAAAATLGRIGAPAAVPGLVALLDEDAELSVVAAGALGSIGDERAVASLLSRLDHPQAAVRQATVAALNSIGHGGAAGRVHSMMADPSPRVREGAARLAGYAGDATCIEPLLALAHDPDESVRRTAVEQLPHLDDPRALDAIAEALDTGTSGVRAAAARALAQVDAAEAIPRLLDACADADPWVRYYAARSLGHQGDLDAVDALVRLAASDPVPPVRIAAIDAISELGSLPGISALQPLADDPDAAVARQALLALGQCGEPGALATLASALGSGEHARTVAALDAIGGGAHASLVAVVAPLARSGDPEIPERALAVLAATGGAHAVAALIDAAEEPRQTAAIVDALSRLDEGQLPFVGRGLEHGDVAVRCAVIEALSRMSRAHAAPLLVAALQDGEEAARVAAAHALGRMDLRAARSTVG